MGFHAPARIGDADWFPWALATLAGTILLAQVGVTVAIAGPGPWLRFEVVLGVVLTGLFSLVVAGGALWHRRRGLARRRYPRLVAWVVGFGLLLLALNLAMIVAWPTGDALNDAAWAIQAAAMGAAAGMLFGSIEARAVERALVAERERLRAESADTRREWLEYLNSHLRHEVLNAAHVMVGYSELLLEGDDLDEPSRGHVERIHQKSRALDEVIRDIGVLVDATAAEDLESVELGAVLEAEVADLRERNADATVRTSLADGVRVAADGLLHRVFSNLLENAVRHHDGGDPEIEVAVETAPDTATVRIADDGPGVPDGIRTSIFDRGRGDHGLGLYLVRILVERYGGSIELAETGPAGTTFAVELRRAPAGSAPGADAAPPGPV